eukprot:4555744-Prymnesium_polylepis.1
MQGTSAKDQSKLGDRYLSDLVFLALNPTVFLFPLNKCARAIKKLIDSTRNGIAIIVQLGTHPFHMITVQIGNLHNVCDNVVWDVHEPAYEEQGAEASTAGAHLFEAQGRSAACFFL